MTNTPSPTAAVIIIGDEILSGQTKDTNLGTIADWANALGLDLKEARVVPDEAAEIIAAVNALKSRYTYVFTTGGIGPTHDDVTADAVAQAFGVAIDHHPEAVRILTEYWAEIGREPNESRLRMARLPHGAVMIPNRVSKAPGFRIGNVFVMAGIPKVVLAMLEEIAPMIEPGSPMRSHAIAIDAGEGDVAAPLKAIQARYPAVTIGSYPRELAGRFSCHIVIRSRDEASLAAAVGEVEALAERLGARQSAED